MAVRLPSEEIEFLRRVEEYCRGGLTQPQMAQMERVPLTSLRLRLFRAGFHMRTTREMVRTGSGERLADLLAAGQVEVEEQAVTA